MGNLTYKINNEKVYFYYGEKLIFRNSKSIPFIVLKKKKNGVETAFSFDKYNVCEKEKGYRVSFWNEKQTEKKIDVDITEDNKNLCFDFYYKGEEDISLTLYKGKNDVVLGLPTTRGVEIKKKKKFFQRKAKTEIVYSDMKLSYRIPDRYYFENKNITEYDIKIKDAIYLDIKTKNPSFVLHCGKKEFAIQENEKIKKYPERSVFIKTSDVKEKEILLWKEKYKNLKGIIIEKKTFDQEVIKKEIKTIHDADLDAIYCVGNNISEKQAKKYFSGKNLFTFGNKKYPDFSEKNTVREYLVTIRKYLDELADGIYFDGYFSKQAILDIHKNIKQLSQEYIQFSIFHTIISELNEDFGYFIIRGDNKIKYFDSMYYSYYNSGEKTFGKEEKLNNYSTLDNKIFTVNILKK